MSSFSNSMFVFWLMRFVAMRDCFSLVSMMIGIFGLGHFISIFVGVLENMSWKVMRFCRGGGF